MTPALSRAADQQVRHRLQGVLVGLEATDPQQRALRGEHRRRQLGRPEGQEVRPGGVEPGEGGSGVARRPG